MATDPNNAWRAETPGCSGWPRTARPDDPNKYFIVSADCHANEPPGIWRERIDAQHDPLEHVLQRTADAVHASLAGERLQRVV